VIVKFAHYPVENRRSNTERLKHFMATEAFCRSNYLRMLKTSLIHLVASEVQRRESLLSSYE